MIFKKPANTFSQTEYEFLLFVYPQCMAYCGYTVVTGSWDKAVMVWNVRQEDAVQMLHGHREGGILS